MVSGGEWVRIRAAELRMCYSLISSLDYVPCRMKKQESNGLEYNTLQPGIGLAHKQTQETKDR